MDDYKPVLKIWKKEKVGPYWMYWAEYDDFGQVILDSPYSTSEIASRFGSERFRETVFGMGIYLFKVRTFEIAIGAYKPLWLRAFEGR